MVYSMYTYIYVYVYRARAPEHVGIPQDLDRECILYILEIDL